MLECGVPNLFPGIDFEAELTAVCGDQNHLFFIHGERRELIWASVLSEWSPESRENILLHLARVNNTLKDHRPYSSKPAVFIFIPGAVVKGPAVLADCPEEWIFFDYFFLNSGNKKSFALRKKERANALDDSPTTEPPEAGDSFISRGLLAPVELEHLIDLSMSLRSMA